MLAALNRDLREASCTDIFGNMSIMLKLRTGCDNTNIRQLSEICRRLAPPTSREYHGFIALQKHRREFDSFDFFRGYVMVPPAPAEHFLFGTSPHAKIVRKQLRICEDTAEFLRGVCNGEVYDDAPDSLFERMHMYVPLLLAVRNNNAVMVARLALMGHRGTRIGYSPYDYYPAPQRGPMLCGEADNPLERYAYVLCRNNIRIDPDYPDKWRILDHAGSNNPDDWKYLSAMMRDSPRFYFIEIHNLTHLWAWQARPHARPQ